MNRTASVIAGVYCAITVSFAVRAEMEKGGGWSGTALRHMYTFIATAPITFPLSAMGMEPDFDRHWVVGLIIVAATAVVYGVVAGIAWVAGRIW
jgi:hypothetical protein